MAGILLGADRSELKQRMDRIIKAEEETVKVMKQLIQSINDHKRVLERMLEKL